MIREMLGWLLDLLFDDFLFKLLMVILVSVAIALTWGAVQESEAEKSECASKGGEMVKVGEYTSYIMVGKVPVPNQVPEYACEVKR
ncbi:hypothetical protein [Paenibacillus pabuli]|uniref:hypothetical protein n=1 Tax=Paenibacillus pabuli TaxID=1472 RepID=UPI001FFF0618|nr:hypothetical protein [Paenibacillus pabuli]UPK45875.1 hypothetical protein KET34_10660 [Paenibacillus pabuli]